MDKKTIKENKQYFINYKNKILGILTINKDKWIKSKEIIKIIGYGDDSIIRLAIHHLRKEGFLIIASSSYGYKLTTNVKEAYEYLQKIRKRSMKILEAYSGIKKGIKKMHQLKLI